MNANVSTLDRIIRLAVAVVATIAAFSVGASSLLGIVLLLVAVIMVVTAVMGFCPLYRLLRISTRNAPESVPVKH